MVIPDARNLRLNGNIGNRSAWEHTCERGHLLAGRRRWRGCRLDAIHSGRVIGPPELVALTVVDKHVKAGGTCAAREIVRREEPEGAIVDGLLGPGRCSGYELVEELKRERPMMRVWMLSGSATDDYRELALRVGAEDLIEKPFIYAELTRAIFGHAEYAPEDSIHAAKSRHVQNVMRACDGNKSEAARCLGITRSAFQKNLKKTDR